MELDIIYQGDCFEVFKGIEDKSIDLILTDPPYGITACKWDIVPDLEKLWIELKRIGKDNCAYVFTASQPFTTDLINSNRKWFKYEWIWVKNKIFGLIKNQPSRATESILVFYKSPCIFNEIQIKRTVKEYKLCYRANDSNSISSVHRPNYKNILIRKSAKEQWYKKPINILEFNSADNRDGKRHPTQKPVALFEYLINTYTNEGDTVLDPFIGSGTTAIACINLNRHYIGCELEKKYYDIAIKRIEGVLERK